MGHYFAAYEARRTRVASDSIPLETARVRYARWDVFVSHKSNDTAKALQIAQRICSNGLSAWVDVTDPTGVRDGPNLADYIRQILASSKSLLAVVSSATKESWWVPFEIGIAFEKQKLLASYGNRTNLPSFLYKWPNVQTDTELDRWCHELASVTKAASYISQMRTLANRF